MLEDDETEQTPSRVARKKKNKLARLKERHPPLSYYTTENEKEELQPSKSAIFQLGDASALDSLNNTPTASMSDLHSADDTQSGTPVLSGNHSGDDELSISSTRKKRKHKGGLARLKERSANLNSSLSSLRSQETPDLRDLQDNDLVSENENKGLLEKPPLLTSNECRTQLPQREGNDIKLTERRHVIDDDDDDNDDDDDVVDKNDTDDDDNDNMAVNYEKILSDKMSTFSSTSNFPSPQKSQAAPKRSASIKSPRTDLLVKSGSSPNLGDSVRASKRSWQTLQSKLGLVDFSQADLRSSVSEASIQSTCSSTIRSVKITDARHRNFLVGQKQSRTSLMGASELERLFPERKVDIFYGTWNCAEIKEVPKNLEDFLLPSQLDTVPNILVITTQENSMDRKQWEIALQETVGLDHVLYHSAQHGTLHMAVFIHRELIWFCSVTEEDTVTVRAFKQIKTKGAVAISFTLFGTSIIFIGSHFKANEGNEKARMLDYQTINTSLRLPRAVVENPLQQAHPQVSHRFDCVFWAGDLNFRITKERDAVMKMIEAAHRHEHPHFEDLLNSDELTQALSRGDIFENYQEGRITFPPTYKFDPGTDNYDTSAKVRIPSYTDRILFKSKKKHDIICLKYNSAAELQVSDHKPVYGLYEVKLRPGRDTIPLSCGQFKRDIYMEAAKRRALHRVAANIKPSSTRSSVCSVM